ncbi:MAG: hypothetical protein RSA90_01480 [Lachnospiraceae bacterium]
MKVIKGEPGYIKKQKKQEIIKTFILFGLVAAILILGYIQTGTKLNMLTVFAILGCLPASKSLVGVITIFPHHSIQMDVVQEISSQTEHLTVAYDMVITSYEKIMPIACIVISDHTICGYTDSTKVDVAYASNHIKNTLAQNQMGQVSVKIFSDYVAFITRAEGMNNIAAIEQPNTTEREERMKQVILNLSF